jgi:hypothetical protein
VDDRAQLRLMLIAIIVIVPIFIISLDLILSAIERVSQHGYTPEQTEEILR